MQVLLVEDHDRIAEFIRQGLEEEGFSIHHVRDGQSGLEALLRGKADVCILDIMLPELSGLEVLERARAQGSATPILLLSAKGEVDDRVRGLELGADDYLPKPFRFDELVARVRALLRRGPPASTTLGYADVEMNLLTRGATRGGVALDLTPREFALLELFLRRPEVALSRIVIGQSAFGLNFDPGTNVVDVYVSTLRKKLHGKGTPLIHTLRGVGYVMRHEAAES